MTKIAPERRKAPRASRPTLCRPVVRGLVIGRTVLYPDDGDVAGTVDAAAKVLRAATESRDS